MPSILMFLNILALKASSHLGIFLGACIIRFKKPYPLKPAKLERIYLNRSDRIGDAVISKPLIELLIRFIRRQWWDAKITIVGSQYNREFLSGLTQAGPDIDIIEEPKDLDRYESKLGNMILKHIHFLFTSLQFRLKHRRGRDERTLFLDLTGGGDLLTILKYKALYNPIVAGPNIFWGSHVMDIAIDHSYIHYSHRNLIESYIEIVEKTLPTDDSFRSYVYDHIGLFYDYKKSKHATRDICLFVGTKEFRNLPSETWYNTILDIAKVFPERSVTVIDDPSNILVDLWANQTFPSNVRVVRNEHSLGAFQSEVVNHRVVIGVDGGGINAVRTITNSLTIYTFAHHDVWSCFTGKSHYIDTLYGKWCIGKSELESGQTVWYAYKRSFLLPTFNITGDRRLFADFPSEGLIEFIRWILKA